MLWQDPQTQGQASAAQEGFVFPGYTEAIRALAQLQAQIEEVLELSLSAAREYGNDSEEYRVEETRRWVDTEGKKIVASVRRKISCADAETRLDMADSLNAALESGEAAKGRSLDDPENRYLLWQWADRILSSLEWAFDSFPEQRTLFHEILPGRASSENWDPGVEKDGRVGSIYSHVPRKEPATPPDDFHFGAAA